MEEAKMEPDGKMVLYDGRTGKPFDSRIAVGIMYMIKLAHMVDDKIHARSEGPYAPVSYTHLFFLFAFFFVLVYVPKVKKHKFASYLIGYGVFRFVMEKFFRDDPRGLLFGFPPSLVLSFLMVLTGIAILFYTLFFKKKRASGAPAA